MTTRIYQTLVGKYPLYCWALALLFAAVSIWHIPSLRIDAADTDALSLQADKDLRFYREMVERFDSGSFLVLSFSPRQPLMSDESLDLLASLQSRIEALEGVQSTTSILNAPLLYSPPQSLGDIAGPLPLLRDAGVDRQQALREFQHSPIYRNALVSADGRTTGMLISLQVDYDFIAKKELVQQALEKDGDQRPTAAELRRLRDAADQSAIDHRQRAASRIAQLRQIVAEHQGEAQIYIGGADLISSDIVHFIRSDMLVFGLILLGFTLISLWLIFRQPYYVLMTLSVCLTIIALMFGGIAASGLTLDFISANFLPLLFIVSLSLSIHLMVRYRELLRRSPDAGQEELVQDTVRQMLRPCAYTALTTVAAFASLAISEIRPVVNFGMLMVLGTTFATIGIFLLLPCGLMLAGKRPIVRPPRTNPISLLFARITDKRPGAVVLISLVMLAVGLGGISRLNVENRFIDYFRDSTEIVRGMVVLDEQLGGTMPLDIVLYAPEGWVADGGDGGDEFDEFDDFDGFADAGGAAEPQQGPPSYWWSRSGLAHIERVHDYLESLPEVGQVMSLAVGYKLARDLGGTTPSDPELALIRQAMPDNLGGILITPYLSDADGQTRLSMRIHETRKGIKHDELLAELQRHLGEDMQIKPDEMRISGLLLLYNNMLQSLFGSQIATLGTVFAVILIMVAVLFRSLALAFVATLPNLLAAGTVLGFMGLAGIPLDLLTITIAAITVGMGVDYSIHYMYRFRNELRACGDYNRAMWQAHASTGRALYYTAITVTAGFAVFVLSNFIPSVYFGLLTCLAMFSALLGALTLLPWLMIRLRPLPVESGGL